MPFVIPAGRVRRFPAARSAGTTDVAGSGRATGNPRKRVTVLHVLA